MRSFHSLKLQLYFRNCYLLHIANQHFVPILVKIDGATMKCKHNDSMLASLVDS